MQEPPLCASQQGEHAPDGAEAAALRRELRAGSDGLRAAGVARGRSSAARVPEAEPGLWRGAGRRCALACSLRTATSSAMSDCFGLGTCARKAAMVARTLRSSVTCGCARGVRWCCVLKGEGMQKIKAEGIHLLSENIPDLGDHIFYGFLAFGLAYFRFVWALVGAKRCCPC